MAKIGKPSAPPKIADDTPAKDKAKKPPPPLDTDDDDYEDGDMATPKRDRYGPDDEPF
ncbi:hypothetical protein IVB41_03450 [Bradyrhizobium sp. 44]|jgi:hypothetical protein|uniref:hypothetical protein n=1 Tax=unclassified Bradyrhizobium TaxID=2631580 RepID=UPI0004B8C371|nr:MULTISPECIES: hypothetical protein [unclassified Bradyrhizobium]MCK1378799.1 hypothetical protein [Bradyrhizobium sp. 24]MCK1282993.1 hypothetical protein [Bradyrhizobium sp. 44]MCK1299035.1 hypothetical protein [Bradyrhizobium sp. 37]MCK1366734.1 hypothetical protein [Bradyrhizobium sp. 62]MCK1398095.1 hypothetical protein [Bradyrhizobium sp. 39]